MPKRPIERREQGEAVIKLRLPLPPSINHYWLHRFVKPKSGPGFITVYISKEGKEFQERVKRLVIAQLGQHKQLTGRLTVSVTIFARDRRKIDIENRTKALFDSLNKNVWVDDEQIDAYSVIRGPVVEGGRCDVEIREKPDTQPTLFP